MRIGVPVDVRAHLSLVRDERRQARLAKPNGRAPAGNTATVKSRRAFEPPALWINGTV